MGSQPNAPIRTYPHGVPCWVDTEQPDVDAAVEFYRGLFGWTFEDAMPPGAPSRYVIAKLGGRDAGAIAGPGEGLPSWSTYVAVDDADATVKRLAAGGAAVRSAPADAGEGGRGAILTDPEGAEFRIWQPRRRVGVQATNVPGGWNFSDLHTRDAKAAIAFYAEAFGWEFDDLGFATMIRRPGYGDHLEATIDPGIRARQAGATAPPGFADAIAWLAAAAEGESANWHVTFTVEDRDQAVADAERLGANVLSQEDSYWTRSALVRDPQGAVFTASQFTPPSG
jgi:predicted enzyme related to lactoylglutathione lyase